MKACSSLVLEEGAEWNPETENVEAPDSEESQKS
jgi:hypothetical protein